MDMEQNPMVQKLMKAFMQFSRASWQQRSVEGIKPSEIMVLFCVKRGVVPDGAGMKVSEISHLLQVTSPTVTQLINGLEEQGLVERSIDPSDRRAVRIKLTEKGEEVTQRASDSFSASFGGLIEFLGVEQSNQLAELLTKALSYYQEKASCGTPIPTRGEGEA